LSGSFGGDSLTALLLLSLLGNGGLGGGTNTNVSTGSGVEVSGNLLNILQQLLGGISGGGSISVGSGSNCN